MADPVEIVDAFLTAVEARDIDAVIGLLDDAVVYDNVPMGAVTGPAAVRDILGPMLAGCDEVAWPVTRSAVAGSVVMNERLDRFRTGDRWIEVPVAGIFEVHDGRITLWRDYFDEATYRKQLNEES